MRLPPPSFGLFKERHDERDWPGLLCSAALIVLLFLVIAGLGPLTMAKTINSTGEGSPLRQAIYILILGYILLAANVVKTPSLLLATPATLVLVIIWCALSLCWAIAPAIAFRRLLLTTMIIWMVFIAVRRAGAVRIIESVQTVLIITLVLNYLAIAILPSAVHQVADVVDPELVGDWRGILPQKNFAGAVCAFTIIMMIFARSGVRLWVRLAVIVGSAFFLYKTGSKTSLWLLLLALSFSVAFMTYNPKLRVLLPPLIALGLGVAVFIGQYWYSDIVGLFDNRAGFTGRVEIWATLMAFVKDHWLLGAGYGSFWNIGPESPVFDYASNWVTKIGAGHNGYLDLLTQIGVPGLLLVIVAMVFDPLVRLFASRGIARSRGAMLLAMLLFCLGHNCTESSLMDRDAIVQVFLLITIALIDVSTRPSDASRAAGAGQWWISPGPWLAQRKPPPAEQDQGVFE